MTGYTTLFLDADGTIFDYDRGERFAMEKSLQHFSIAGNSGNLLELYREINKSIWRDFEQGKISAEDLKIERFRRFATELGVEFDPVNFSRIYLEYLSQATFLLSGARGVLDQLKNNYTMILLTNGLSGVQRNRVRLAEVEDYFRKLIISEEIGVAKPAPGIFEKAWEASGRPPLEEVLMVGDSLESDIKGGMGFGLDTCWLRGEGQEKPPEINPTYIIEEITQLPDILQGRVV